MAPPPTRIPTPSLQLQPPPQSPSATLDPILLSATRPNGQNHTAMGITHPLNTTKSPPRDLTTAEILSNLLSVLLPVPIPLALDLGDDADIRWLFACLGNTGGDANDPVAFLGGDGMNVDGSVPDSSKASVDEEPVKRHEDQEMVDAACLSADPESLENSLVPKISLNVKGKGKDTGEDVDVTMLDHDEDSEGGLPADFKTKHASDVAAATTSANNAVNSNTIASGSNSGTPSTGATTSNKRRGAISKSATKSTLSSTSKSSKGSFSPVDWSKTHLHQVGIPTHEKSPQVVKLSSRAMLVLKSPAGQPALNLTPLKETESRAAASPPQSFAQSLGSTPNRSYTLPALPEGSIAALRQEMLGHVYPNSSVLGDVKGLGLGSREGLEDMVMGADAGERMLSPESEIFEEDQEVIVMDEDQEVVGQGSSDEDQEVVGQDKGEEESRDVEMEPEKDRKHEEGQDKEDKINETTTSELASVSDLKLGSAAPLVIERITSTPPAASSLSSLSSVPSTDVSRSSSVRPSPSPLSGSRRGSTAPSSTSQEYADLPVVDLSGIKFGPPKKKVKLDTFPVPDANSATPSATSTAALTLPGRLPSPLSLIHSKLATIVDKAQVQDLVPDSIAPSSSSLHSHPPSSVYKPEENEPSESESSAAASSESGAETSALAIRTKDSLPSLSPSDDEDSTTQPRPMDIEMDAEDAAEVHQEPEATHTNEPLSPNHPDYQEPESQPVVPGSDNGSPLFTPKPNWQDEDFDLVSSPAKSVNVVKLKTPAGRDAVDVDSPSPPPMRVSPRKNASKKATGKNAVVRSPSVISVSSGDEMEVISTKATRRPQPSLRLRAPPVKLEIFDAPPPTVIDLSTPVSTPARKRPIEPPAPVEDSPLTSRSPSPASPEHHAARDSESSEGEPSPSFDIEKYTAKLNDDDADIVPVKRKRKVSAVLAAATDVRPAIAPTKSITATVAGSSSKNVKFEPDDEDGAPAVVKPQLDQQRKTRLRDLMANRNKKQSAALTRVKKRKRSANEGAEKNDTDEEEEGDHYNKPPLKRAKMRSGEVGDKGKGKAKEKPVVSKTKTNVKEVDKQKKPPAKDDTPKRYPSRAKPVSASVKTPTRRPRGQHKTPIRDVVWPTMKNPNFDQFLKCDFCDVWYHIGCVGVEPDDVRLEDTEIYQCPACEAGFVKEESPVKNITESKVKANSGCARPHCPRSKKQKKKSHVAIQEPPESFVIEAFVGRNREFVAAKGVYYLEYLVKWHDYSYGDATWEPFDAMGLANPGPLVDTFEKEAAAQGIDLDDSPNVVLLESASEAGWNLDRIFVEPE